MSHSKHLPSTFLCTALTGPGSARSSLECDVTGQSVCPVIQDINNHIYVDTELTKNGLDTVEVPEKSEVARQLTMLSSLGMKSKTNLK